MTANLYRGARWQRDAWDHPGPWQTITVALTATVIAGAVLGAAPVVFIAAAALVVPLWHLRDITWARGVLNRGGCKHPSHATTRPICGCTRRMRQATHTAELINAAHNARYRWVPPDVYTPGGAN